MGRVLYVARMSRMRPVGDASRLGCVFSGMRPAHPIRPRPLRVVLGASSMVPLLDTSHIGHVLYRTHPDDRVIVR